MPTRLNNEMRDEILNSVLRATDLAEQRAKIEQATSKLAAKLCREAQPKDWFALISGYPSEWFKLDSSVSIQPGNNPLHALKDEGSYPSWHIGYPDPIPVAIELILTDEQAEKHFGPLVEEATAWRERATEVRTSLRTSLLSCRTVEQIEQRMPELMKHVPKVSKSYPLVAPSNVLSQLTKLGFDRTVSV